MRRLPPLLVAVGLVAGLLVGPAHRASGVAPFLGSAAGERLVAPAVGMAGTPSGLGYWIVAGDGGVFAYGDAAFHGSTGALRLNSPIVGMAATPSGQGYWLVAGDGGVFAFGDARFSGSLGGQRINEPVVGMAASPFGGYWLVAADGGIFAYGGAPFLGSLGAQRINEPVVGMAASLDGQGYWLVAGDGGVFAYGSAPFRGSTGSSPLVSPIVELVRSAQDGYWLMAGDGGVFSFGAPFWGSAADRRLSSPVVGAAGPPDGSGYWLASADGGIVALPDGAPFLTSTDVVTGLSGPWDIGFLPGPTMVFTEKVGTINAVVNGVRRVLGTPAGTFTGSEAGMMGLAVAPDFATSRLLYTCRAFSLSGGGRDARVEAWAVNPGVTSVTLARTVVTAIPVNSGRHTGCRPRFGADGQLYVGTGDAVDGTNPQNDASLGGKVLRVDPATGLASAGNPGGQRWITKGHRNVQGIAVQPGTGRVFSVEHGTDRDDEVNRLVPGGNAGWDPVDPSGYDELAPMTDLAKFPDAMVAVWASGLPTVACSGATFLTGPQWKDYEGRLVMACLKSQQLLSLTLDPAGTTADEVERIFGGGASDPRMRAAVQGPDGSLYVATSNGVDDRIFRLTPS